MKKKIYIYKYIHNSNIRGWLPPAVVVWWVVFLYPHVDVVWCPHPSFWCGVRLCVVSLTNLWM